jgi:hypothetical protein
MLRNLLCQRSATCQACLQASWPTVTPQIFRTCWLLAKKKGAPFSTRPEDALGNPGLDLDA